MRFVLDNSVTMRWLFGDGSRDDLGYAERILELLGDTGTVALVPAIWALEAANVIARADARSLITEARSREFLTLLQDMAIEPDRETFDHAFEETLHLAQRYALSAYDAAYLELSLREGIPLATLDNDLVGALAETGGTRA